MTFADVKTPKQLMMYLDQNFKYGVVDNNDCDAPSSEKIVIYNQKNIIYNHDLICSRSSAG